MKDLEAHVGSAELAKLLERTRVRPGSAEDTVASHSHLSQCVTCREAFMDLALLDRQLGAGQLGPEGLALVATRHEDCPDPKIWREIASGVTNSENTLSSVEHASRCDYCGPLLHEAVAEVSHLNQPLTEAELERISNLKSATPEGKRRLARQISGKISDSDSVSRASGLNSFFLPRLAIWASVAVAILAVSAWFLSHRDQETAVDRLLARAYSEKRTAELRIAGADYAPVRIARGSQSSFSERPASLLKAEAMIATQLESHPADSAWLHAQAKADLLEGKYDAAVESLRRAQELNPHSSTILTDLATALYQQALQEDKRVEFGPAYEDLSEALKITPDEPVALFNRAIVAEHEFLYQQALADWEHYLRVDPGSQWAAEARDRAAALREKLKKREEKSGPLLSPAEIVAFAAKSNTPSEEGWLLIDSRVEEYLEEAVRVWLPQAFPESKGHGVNSNSSESARRALFFLADLTSRRHGDRWLADLLKASPAQNFPRAANALALSVSANRAADYDVAREQSELAEKFFRGSADIAGALRAEFERTYAAQMERQVDGCRDQASAALDESEKYPYPWVQIQLGLEKSVCSYLAGDIGTDERITDQSEQLALKSGYDALYLRALFFAADDRLNMGDRVRASAMAGSGLDHYWSGRLPRKNAYNFYAESAFIADAGGLPNLQLATWLEDAVLLGSDEDLLRRAWAHNFTGDAASAAQQPQVAAAQYAEAARLFALAPSTEATRRNALETELRTARMEARLGRYGDAIGRLAPLQEKIGSHSKFLQQIFYGTLGEVELRTNHGAEAEKTLRPALVLAEENLVSLRTEEERTVWSKDAAPAYLALSEAQLLQGRKQEALETYAWYLGATERSQTANNSHKAALQRMASSGTPTSTASPLESRRAFLSSETVVAYAALPDGLAIWVYDNRGVKSHWIPESTERLEELARRLHDLAADPKSQLAALRRDARSLYQALVEPVEADLAPGRTLVIETEGWLARVPFEVLVDSEGHYLTERESIVHAFGEASKPPLKADASLSADAPALIVGSAAASLSDGALSLPDAAPEADAVAGRFKSAELLTGERANLEAVLQALPRAEVFHFAGHSLAANHKTGLLLRAKDGTTTRLMDGDTVRNLHLPELRLAVLSACNTASSESGAGSFDNVADTFLRAGVPHVVASRWAVDSNATRRFIDDFYKQALAGQSVPDALRTTSRSMLADPRTSHPYYWSAFAAYGRP